MAIKDDDIIKVDKAFITNLLTALKDVLPSGGSGSGSGGDLIPIDPEVEPTKPGSIWITTK